MLQLKVRSFLEWMIRVHVPTAICTNEIMEMKSEAHREPMEDIMFARSSHSNYNDIETKQV